MEAVLSISLFPASNIGEIKTNYFIIIKVQKAVLGSGPLCVCLIEPDINAGCHPQLPSIQLFIHSFIHSDTSSFSEFGDH